MGCRSSSIAAAVGMRATAVSEALAALRTSGRPIGPADGQTTKAAGLRPGTRRTDVAEQRVRGRRPAHLRRGVVAARVALGADRGQACRRA
jgi:hypothetical protein